MITMEQVIVLVGKEVELLCFAQYIIYIHLDGDILLTAEAGFEHTHEDTKEVYSGESPMCCSGLMAVLECSVVSASIDENGHLCLAFSNADRLIIFKETGYDSYRLKIGDRELFA